MWYGAIISGKNPYGKIFAVKQFCVHNMLLGENDKNILTTFPSNNEPLLFRQFSYSGEIIGITCGNARLVKKYSHTGLNRGRIWHWRCFWLTLIQADKIIPLDYKQT